MKKKPVFSVFLIIFLVYAFKTKAQNPKINILPGSRIITTIENTSHFSKISIGGEQESGNDQSNEPGSKEKTIWETTFNENKLGVISASKTLKRIIYTMDGPQGLEKYDSENTFESTNGTEGWIKELIQVLNKPSVHLLLDSVGTNNKNNAALKTDITWNYNIPVYEPSKFWNGLTIEIPSFIKIENNSEWNTEFPIDNGLVQNKFSISEVNSTSFKVKIKSKLTYKKGNENTLTANGAPSSFAFSTEKKEKTFDGEVLVDAKLMLILKGSFQIEIISILKLNGNETPQKGHSTTTISNVLVLAKK